jgi:hypothetical protein
MKEASKFASIRVDARQVRTLLQIALPTGERKIVKLRWAAMLFGKNMLNMETAPKSRLRN